MKYFISETLDILLNAWSLIPEICFVFVLRVC